MIFNIYYINIAKVYEISMMIDNVQITSIVSEKSKSEEATRHSNINTSLNYLNQIKADLGFTYENKLSSANKIVENIEIKTTKSILLRKIIDKSKSPRSFKDLNEGDLIKLENVRLKLHNEIELRQVKTLANGAFKEFSYEGLKIDNLVNSILKDYSYMLIGQFGEEQLIIKIPLQFENEFENLYNIDDLLIGNVTLIGIYKKEIKKSSIKNTLNIMQELGQSRTYSKIQKSRGEDQGKQEDATEAEDESFFHFVDIIAIIQDIYRDEKIEVIEVREKNHFKRLIKWFSFKFHWLCSKFK